MAAPSKPMADAKSAQAPQKPHGRAMQPWHQAWDTSERDEAEDDQGWLTTFGDLMSLLLVLFVFLVAFASFEPERYAVSSEPQTVEGTGQAVPTSEGPPAETPSEGAQAGGGVRGEATLGEDLGPAFEGLGDEVQIQVQKGQINLEIKDAILFAPGTASLSREGLPVLNRIAELLKDSDYYVSIEGHTDNVPIHTLRYPSNWELSTGRAAAVLRYLAARGVPAERMRAIGYADTRPIAPNDTPESRAKNRRVTLVLHRTPLQESTQPPP